MLIVLAEILFWILIAAGMMVRYGLRKPTLSKILLLAVPLVDVALIFIVIVELRAGKPVELAHQLAGIYLGISIILGPSIIKWCDKKAYSWHAKIPTQKPEKRSFAIEMRSELSFLGKWIAAMAVGFFVNRGLMLLAVNESQQDALSQASTMPFTSVLFVALFGPGWLLLFGTGKEKA